MKRECLLLTMVPLIAFANTGYYVDDQEEYELEAYDDSDIQNDFVADDYGMQNANTPMQPNQNSTGFQLYTKDIGFFFGAEFLYWTVKEGSTLQYAYRKNFPVFQVGPQDGAAMGLAGRAQKANFNWDPGFRLKAGYQFGHDNWQLFAEYTWFHARGRNTSKKPAGFATQDDNELIPVLAVTFPTIFTSFVNEVKSHIRFTENILDLKVERFVGLSKYLVLGFNAGYEGAWIAQHWKLMALSNPVFAQHTLTKENWHFSGAGPLIGVDSDWYLTKNFTLYFNGMGSILYGFYDHFVETLPSTGVVNNILQRAHSKNHHFVPHTTLEIGLDWDYRFGRRSSVNFYAGYEINSWFNLEEVYHFDDNGTMIPGADLAYSVEKNVLNTHGLTVGVEFHF